MSMNSAKALFANEAFYLAFSHKDLEAMDRLWARSAPVLCIHPGWPALASREDIMISWHNILGNSSTGAIAPHHARAFVYEGFVIVQCYEEIQEDVLAATNVFVVEEGEFRLVHHQASPCSQPPPRETADPVSMQ
jgi:hypothetical protein